MFWTLAVAALIVVLVFNLVVSRRVWRNRKHAGSQRIAEIGLIWCAPVLGGLVALALAAERPDRSGPERGLYGGAAGAAATSSWTNGSGASHDGSSTTGT